MRPIAGLINRKRPTFAFSTWFCLPEENMMDLEILNRASAVIVPARKTNWKYKYHIVTCSHVVAPWKWPKYYAEEWLSAVNETHTHYTVELRQDNGVFITQNELIPTAYHHPTRDLAVLHLENEDSQIDVLSKLGFKPWNLYPRTLPALPPGHAVEFSGHELVAPRPNNIGGGRLYGSGDYGTSSDDDRVPLPRIIPGQLEFDTNHQQFCRSRTILAQGMCGGPVLVDAPAGNSEGHDRNAPLIYGIVDGIIPTDHPIEQIRGMASYVPSHVIEEFLDTIENGTAEGVEGGHAARFVGADQDPKKMDIEEIMRKYK